MCGVGGVFLNFELDAFKGFYSLGCKASGYWSTRFCGS